MDSTNMSHKSNQASSSDPGTEMENFEVQNIPSSDLKFRKTCIEILVKNSKLLNECTRNIQELSEKVDTLTGLMKRQSLTAVENTNIMLLDFFLDFPIKNVQMLDHVEKILENEAAFNRLVSIQAHELHGRIEESEKLSRRVTHIKILKMVVNDILLAAIEMILAKKCRRKREIRRNAEVKNKTGDPPSRKIGHLYEQIFTGERDKQQAGA
ncbi:hypothetical protein JTB14_034226 [Gonioctena quinquepunctata]|nr:hypothetical protein JTB14_034226 [Gonioctena quinquepunctata]